jgi:hypothetical protein
MDADAMDDERQLIMPVKRNPDRVFIPIRRFSRRRTGKLRIRICGQRSSVRRIVSNGSQRDEMERSAL